MSPIPDTLSVDLPPRPVTKVVSVLSLSTARLRGGDMDRPFRSRRLPLDAYNRRVNALIQERGGGGRSVGVGKAKVYGRSLFNEC